MKPIVFEVLHKGKVFGYERLTDKGWEFMVPELNPSGHERWTKGVMGNDYRRIPAGTAPDLLTPKNANTNKKLCKLKRDNLTTRTDWILVSKSHIDISNQVSGEQRTGHVKLSKKTFERFIRFYETGK